MIEATGAEILVTLLERQGITVAAGIPGGANLPIYDALSRSSIRHVLARHEQGAGFIAQGMARATGKPAVCLATSGPGATNLLTALADAKADSVPVVAITGQVPRRLLGTDAFQEIDIYGMSLPATKHNFLVRSPEELLAVIPEAFRIAASGRPGPVLVDVPRDVQTEACRFPAWPTPGRPDASPPPDGEGLLAAARLINASRRPVLYLGGGAAGAGEAIRALAEKGAIPAAMTLMGLAALPADHPLRLGMLGMHASRSTNLVIEECDLLLAVGARFDDRATGKVERFCPGASVVHIDIDPAEIDKLKAAHVSIVGDAGTVLEALLLLVEARERREWLTRVAELRERHAGSDLLGSPRPRGPRDLLRLAARLAGMDSVIVTDVGQHQMWTAQSWPFAADSRWLTSGGLGTMGFGLPAAIGASLACPERRVVLVSGDGSLLMNVQELATAVQEGANLTILLMDNGSLGMVRQQQDLFFGGRVFSSRFRARTDYCAVAAGFGLGTWDLEGGGDPAAILAEALTQPGPCLVRVPVDPEANVWPIVPPGAANRDMIGGESHAAVTA